MANTLKDREADLNPGEANSRKRFSNSGEHDRNPDLSDVQRREETGDLENAFNAPSAEDPVEQARQNEDANWDSSGFTGANNKAKTSGVRKGPIGAIIGGLIAATIGVGGIFGGPTLLLVHLQETFLGKFNAGQETSLTIRTDEIIANKFSSRATGGICTQVLTIMCKYERPSNRLLTQMEKNGWKAYAADDTDIRTKGPFPNKRPSYLIFTDETGKASEKIPADRLKAYLRDNAGARAAFRRSYNPRFISLADDTFKAFKERFGTSGKDKLATEKDPNKIQSDIETNSSGTNIVGEEGDEALRAFITTEVEKETDQLAKTGKGNAVGLIAGAACGLANVPQLIVRVARNYQMAQGIKYATQFLIVAAAIKAGDATSAEVSGAASQLTQTDSNGHTATDSFGVRYANSGDLNIGSDAEWNKRIAGASVAAVLGGAAAFVASGGVQSACKFATNPVTGAAFDVATSETILIPVIASVAAFGLSLALPTLVQNVLPGILDVLPYQQLESFFLGDFTKNLSPLARGDVLTEYSAAVMGQTANLGANMPLTVSQQLAYNQTTQQVQLAAAQEDRATLSPLDVSSQYTALGSIVHQIMPYFTNTSSISGVLASLGSIATSSLGILGGATVGAVDNTAEYTMCQDPTITSTGGGSINDRVATDPFCNIQYGVPSQYLNMDPETALSDLIASGQVDPTTGDPIPDDNNLGDQIANQVTSNTENTTSSLSSWMSLCEDGSTTHAEDCVINSQTTAEYAIYSIDHRVQKTMDGEDTSLDGAASSSPSSTNTTTSAFNDSSLLTLLNTFSNTQVQPSVVTTAPSVAAAPETNVITPTKSTVFSFATRRYAGVVS